MEWNLNIFYFLLLYLPMVQERMGVRGLAIVSHRKDKEGSRGKYGWADRVSDIHY
jgi:hypothetical protein